MVASFYWNPENTSQYQFPNEKFTHIRFAHADSNFDFSRSISLIEFNVFASSGYGLNCTRALWSSLSFDGWTETDNRPKATVIFNFTSFFSNFYFFLPCERKRTQYLAVGFFLFQVASTTPLHRLTLCSHTTHTFIVHVCDTTSNGYFEFCCSWYGSLVLWCAFVAPYWNHYVYSHRAHQ